MGTEMIAKATDSFERKHRKCLDAIEEPDLFYTAPQLSIAVVAIPEAGHSFSTDEDCRFALVDDQLLVIRGVTVVGEVQSPPRSVVDMLGGSRPSLSGRVQKVFQLTGKADILLEQL